MPISKILKLINTKEYNEAKIIINKEDQNTSRTKFLWGYLYIQKDFPENSEKKAKAYFQDIIHSKEPLIVAFEFLSHLEELDADKVRILEAGLEKFPKSETLLMDLIELTNINDLENITSKTNIRSLDSKERYSSFLLQYLYKSKEFEKIIKTDFLSLCEFDHDQKIIIKLIEAFSYFELTDFTKASELFESVYKEDIANITSYFSLIGWILSSWKLEIDFADLIAKLPFEIDDIPIFFGDYYFDLQHYLNLLVNELLKGLYQDTKSIGKLKGIRALYNAAYENIPYINDLKYAFKIYPESKEFFLGLISYYESTDNYKKAFDYGFKHFLKVDTIDDLKIDFDYIEYTDDKEFSSIIGKVQSHLYEIKRKNEQLISKLIEPIIEYYFEHKNYSEILHLIKNFDTNIFLKNCGFEIAFSFKRENDLDNARKSYEKYLEYEPESISSLNNLALIHEETDNFEKAIDLFKKAIEIAEDSEDKGKYVTRLKRIEDLYAEKKEKEKSLIEAAITIQSENYWVISKILAFSSHQDDLGLIKCSYKLLPKYFEVSEMKANEIIKDFLKKNYILKISQTEHKMDTNTSVYKVNPHVLSTLEELKLKDENFSLLYDLFQDVSIDAFEQYGFDPSLMKAIEKINDPSLKDMIKRDVSENFFSLLTKSYKSSIVMSGSILEAVVLNRLRDAGIKNYKVMKGVKEVSKNIVTMNLNELLEIASKENLIDHEIFHHSHAIRGYRNLIHPGVEERKNKTTPRITYDNAKLAWDVMKKVLKEI